MICSFGVSTLRPTLPNLCRRALLKLGSWTCPPYSISWDRELRGTVTMADATIDPANFCKRMKKLVDHWQVRGDASTREHSAAEHMNPLFEFRFFPRSFFAQLFAGEGIDQLVQRQRPGHCDRGIQRGSALPEVHLAPTVALRI